MFENKLQVFLDALIKRTCILKRTLTPKYFRGRPIKSIARLCWRLRYLKCEINESNLIFNTIAAIDLQTFHRLRKVAITAWRGENLVPILLLRFGVLQR